MNESKFGIAYAALLSLFRKCDFSSWKWVWDTVCRTLALLTRIFLNLTSFSNDGVTNSPRLSNILTSSNFFYASIYYSSRVRSYFSNPLFYKEFLSIFSSSCFFSSSGLGLGKCKLIRLPIYSICFNNAASAIYYVRSTFLSSNFLLITVYARVGFLTLG